jgi:two-component system, NarL family, response regulator DesR
LPESLDMPALQLTGPLADIDLLEPEPSVAVIAAAPLLRRRIAAALDFDRLPLVAEAQRPCELLDGAARERRPTVAVLACDDPDDVLAALHDVRRELPAARPVIVTERLDGGDLRRALRAGAAAAVPADRVETALALAVRAASQGLVVVPEAMRDRLEPPALSPREREVLALAARGATTGEIAAELTVSTGTVKRHLSSCFSKLGVENRSEALALLIDADLHPADDAAE